MRRYFWNFVSVLMVLTMIFAAVPVGQVKANTASIQGTVMLSVPGLNLQVAAYRGDTLDTSCTGSVALSEVSALYEFTLTSCNLAETYTIVVTETGASPAGYSFANSVVKSADYILVDPEMMIYIANTTIYPVSRKIGGTVYKPNGYPWPNFAINYTVNGVPSGPATTDKDGVFTLSDVNDGSAVTISQTELPGFTFTDSNWTLTPPLGRDYTDMVISSKIDPGTLSVGGQIVSTLATSQACRVGATVSAVVMDNVTVASSRTDANGNYKIDNLPSLAGYKLVPFKPGCAYNPEFINFDLNGEWTPQYTQLDPPFEVSNQGFHGFVKPQGMGDSSMATYDSLAYYLIATYTTTSGASYSTNVNWVDGSYELALPTNSGGTLSISRIGGTAAFGYKTLGASATFESLPEGWVEQNFTLIPDRTISGKIAGQNSMPVQKDATIDFGSWLRWTQPGSSTSFQLTAQPKIYVLSPKEVGIISSTPLRQLANLTTAATVALPLPFTLSLKAYTLSGCLNSYQNDPLVLVTGATPSVRFQPAASYGTGTYPATLTKDGGCGLASYAYSVNLPKGIAGTLIVDNHQVFGNTAVDGMTGDANLNLMVAGDRTLTGRLNVANPNIQFPEGVDFKRAGMFILTDTATKATVDPAAKMDGPEFTFPALERKSYTLSYDPNKAPVGYTATPASGYTANLTAADVDLPGTFWLTHKPIDSSGITPYFQAPAGEGAGVMVGWSCPETNPADKLIRFEVQAVLANTTFSETAAPAVYDSTCSADNPNQTNWFDTAENKLTAGKAYKWRVRAVYEFDKGPWTDPSQYQLPLSPANYAIQPYNPDTDPAVNPDADTNQNNVIFLLKALPFEGTELTYTVWYGTNPGLTSTTAKPLTAKYTYNPDNPIVMLTTETPPAFGQVIYWLAKVELVTSSTTTVIMNWSPTQKFFNRFKSIDVNSIEYRAADSTKANSPIQFKVADGNATLPSTVAYQVQFADSWGAFAEPPTNADSAIFVRPAAGAWSTSITVPSLDVPSGMVMYRMRLVFVNDMPSNPPQPVQFGEWVNGPSMFNWPWY